MDNRAEVREFFVSRRARIAQSRQGSTLSGRSAASPVCVAMKPPASAV